MTPFFILLLICIFLFVLITKRWPNQNKLNLPPSPPPLPIIGHLHFLTATPHWSLQAVANKYGPVLFLHFGRTPALLISSAEIAKEILTTHDITFSNRFQTRVGRGISYEGIDVGFSPYGDYWRKIRKICVVELLSSKRVDHFCLVRESEVLRLVAQIKSNDREVINLGDMIIKTIGCIITRCCFGGANKEGIAYNANLEKLVRVIIKLAGKFFFHDFFPSIGWIDHITGLERQLKNALQDLDGFLDDLIEEMQLSRLEENYDPQNNKSFLEILLDLKKDGILGADISRDHIKAVSASIFIGGLGSPAVTLEWAMVLLMKNPRKMKKAQEEVRRVVGQKMHIDEEDIESMPYLKCVMKEALRLYPPTPFLLPRESSEEVKLQGYDIPKKTMLLINVWAIQRDPQLWEEPLEFLPERFQNYSVDFLGGKDFQYAPFGGGRRGCPGISFGNTAMEYILANLLHWFDWKLPDGSIGRDTMDVSETGGIVMHKKLPLHLIPVFNSPH